MNMLLFKIYLFITTGKIQGNNIKTNILKTMAATWNEEFESPDGSYSVLDI